jgi:hypothetical protein
VRLHPVAHDAAEEHAAHAETRTARGDGAGCFSFECRRVDGAFARNDEIGVARTLVEADRVEHELRALDELAAERCERGAEAAARTCARQIAIGRELLERRQPFLEDADGRGVGALLRPEHACGASFPEQRVAHVACDAHRQVTQPVTDDRAEADPAVHGRRPADADEQRGRPRRECREEQLAEPPARRAQRVELRLRDLREPDRLRALDDGGAVVQHQPVGRDRAAESIRDGSRVPGPTERGVDHRSGAFAAVGDGRDVHLEAVDPPEAGG